MTSYPDLVGRPGGEVRDLLAVSSLSHEQLAACTMSIWGLNTCGAQPTQCQNAELCSGMRLLLVVALLKGSVITVSLRWQSAPSDQVAARAGGSGDCS